MNTTIFVSGYARTGTTTMMRMLAAAGVKVLASERSTKRINVHHPDGVYEMDDVGAWLKQSKPKDTAGKALKLVAQYIHNMPLDRPACVLFMVRDVHEIVASLLAQKVVWEAEPVAALQAARAFLVQNDVPTLNVDYHEMRKYPNATAAKVAGFLEDKAGRPGLDTAAMAKVIDPEARKKSYEVEGKREGLLSFNLDLSNVRVIGGDAL